MSTIILIGDTYTQDFDDLANSGSTSDILPLGWNFLETGSNANDTYSINDGSSNSGNTYSYGSTNSTDRAFGTLLSSSLTSTVGAVFTNNTGSTITDLQISYRGEQWRLGTLNREDRLDFQYSLNATALNNGNWVDVDSLDFIAPVTTGSTGARDGNVQGNFTNVSDTISNLSIADGETFWIRWTDFNASGADDGLAIDDFSLTPIFASGNPTVNLSVSATEIIESATTTNIVITATASTAVLGDQTVNIDVSGNATINSDFSLSGLTITILDGQTTGTITFNVINDSLFEGDETLTLSLSNPSAGIALGNTTSQDITIIDNDVIQITEFMYSGANGEFVEFTNLGDRTIDLGGWSYSDDNRVAGSFDLSAFGNVQSGESVILTETSESDFRTAWNLPSSVKVIGGLNVRNLGRNDEINIFDETGFLVDRLTYGDQSFSGTIRTQNASGWTFQNNLVPFEINTDWLLSNVGDAQNSYASTGGDIGSPGIYNPNPPNPNAPTIEVDLNATTDFLDGGILNLLSVTNSGAISGVISDPTDPAKIFGINFTLADPDTPINDLTVTVNSSNQAVVPDSNLILTGTGASRNLTITPVGVGFSNISVTVSDGTGTGTYIINYGASEASVNPDTTRFFTGASDASTAIALDANFMLVADDEDQVIRLYSRTQSGTPLNGFDFSSLLGLSGSSEVDIEASSRNGNTIYWMGSHSNNSSGKDRPNRERIFATEVNGVGENTTLTFAGYYQFLEDDLIAWDNDNGHGLGAGFLGLQASAASGVIPESPNLNGFNIEGLTFAPDNSTGYVSFRAPNLPTSNRTDALIIPVTNFTEILDNNGGTSGSAEFGEPIFLNLGGRGIRSIERNNTGEYLIVAGPADSATGIAPKDFRLYTWTGNAQDAPVLKDADLTALNSGGSFESIVEVPDNLKDADIIPLLVDNGDTIWYNNNTVSKDLPQANHQKFRQEFVQLSTPLTKIHEIQGNSETQISNTIGNVTRTDASPLLGQTVTIEGVVVGDFQRVDQLRGFFIQEESFDQDNDPTTSEGLFIFTGNTPIIDVQEGQIIRVTGVISEFFGMTQITATADGSLQITDEGNNLNLVPPTVLDLPVTGDINEFYEQFEGMRVQFADKLFVSEYFQLGRFGQIVLTAGGRPFQYTHTTDNPTVEGYNAFLDDLARKRIILDDDNNIQNTTGTVFHPQPNGFGVGEQGVDFFRGGDTVSDLTGVLHWSFAGAGGTDAWRIRPTEANPVQFTVENPRPLTAPDVGGNVKVASFNVLNYFNTIDTMGGSGSPRGADSDAEFDRQNEKLIQALVGIDADIFGLIEMENNGDTANPAVKELVTRLNAFLGADIYDFINTGKVGDDQITNAFIYKKNVVKPLGITAILDDPQFTDPNNTGQSRNRPAIAQNFIVIDGSNPNIGESFNVVVNHLKSKGSGTGAPLDDDQGDGQARSNDTRTKAADFLVNTWIPSDPTGLGDPDYLIIGDLNAYKGENPITTIKNAGYTDLIELFNGNEAYSYVFDGQLGYLDHALGNQTITPQVTGVKEWLINADEVPLFDYNDTILDIPGEQSFEVKPSGNELYEPNAFRTSDHDPVLVGLDLLSNPILGDQSNNRIFGTSENDLIKGIAGNNFLNGQGGNDTLVGGAGNDVLRSNFGNNVFMGGAGNDRYFVNSVNDVVIELENEGNDTIVSTVDYTLPDHVENLNLMGSATSATGNNLDNRILGNAQNNVLMGVAGNNLLNGKSGDNLLIGGTGSDVLRGGSGNDTLVGGAGRDRLFGGGGNDVFDYQDLTDSLLSTGFDSIRDFKATKDKFLVSVAPTVFTNAGSVNGLNQSAIASIVTPDKLGNIGDVAQFSFRNRTFIAINDDIPGFQGNSDAMIEVTGLVGTLNLDNFITA